MSRTQRKKKAAVLLATYNRAQILESALKEMAKSKDFDLFDIYVVDNGSTDNTERMIKNYKFVHYTKNSVNKFVSHALNQAFFDNNIANKYPYTILIANDVLVGKNMFIELVRFMENHPKAGLTAPVYYEYATDELTTCGLSINTWTSLLKNHLPENPDGINHYVSCYALPSKIFQKLGGYNNVLYPMIYEEPDLGERVLKAGYEIFPTLKAKMWHPIELGKKKGGAKTVRIRKERLYNNIPKSYLFFRNRIIYMSTYSHPLQFLVFYFICNPLISLYYLRDIDHRFLKYAVIGLLDGTRFALTRNTEYIMRRNKTVLNI